MNWIGIIPWLIIGGVISAGLVLMPKPSPLNFALFLSGFFAALLVPGMIYKGILKVKNSDQIRSWVMGRIASFKKFLTGDISTMSISTVGMVAVFGVSTYILVKKILQFGIGIVFGLVTRWVLITAFGIDPFVFISDKIGIVGGAMF